MNRAVLADTGPLYAAVDPDDAYHRRACEDLRRLAQEKRSVVIAYPTLLESHSLVLHRLGTRTATVWLKEILSASALLNPSPQDYLQAAARIASLPDQSVTLFDGIIAVLAKRTGAQVWTYDHHFDVMRVRVWRVT